jgi:hypothetical protein
MRDIITQTGSVRFFPSMPGVPDAQARALDRRHRLERQQRSFQGSHRGIAAESALASDPFAVMDEAGPGPA